VIVRILEHFIWQELVKFTLIGAALVDFVWQENQFTLICSTPEQFVWQLPQKILRRCCDHGEKLPINSSPATVPNSCG
jgi:hypothetical protein